jgi:hypothetical protein
MAGDLGHIIGNSATMLLTRYGDGVSNFFNIFVGMLMPVLLVTIIQNLSQIYIINDVKEQCVEYLQYYNILPKEYKITLSSRRFYNKFGSTSNDISNEKIAILYFIHNNMKSFEDLFKLEQDYVQSGDGWFGESEEFSKRTKSYYTIDQEIPVCVKTEGKYYINILCDDTCINDDDDKKNNSKLTKINKLTLITNKNMEYLKSFIKDCVEYHERLVNDTQTRYIYTYLGEDDNNKLTYDKEVFHPYASLNGLIGDNIKEIKNQMDFFHSEEGRLWYTKRNLPYQLTHLYHGEPGTGKSIIASAIAKEYNLHIIKIKLSSIKDDREFIRVFKNKEFSGQNIEYRDMLFLFDEIDVEFDKLLKLHMLNEKILMNNEDDNGVKQTKSSNNMSKSLPNFNTNELSLGTILEEINGINQMYGRKMILITNNFDKLKEIHNGALVRPGRVDTIIEFKKCKKKDILIMLGLYYDTSYNLLMRKCINIKDNQWTPAEVSNFCKTNKHLDKCIESLSC